MLRYAKKKPFGGEDVLRHFQHPKPSTIAFVGDRLLTDVVFANLNAFHSVYVTQIVTEQGDNLFAKWVMQFPS